MGAMEERGILLYIVLHSYKVIPGIRVQNWYTDVEALKKPSATTSPISAYNMFLVIIYPTPIQP